METKICTICGRELALDQYSNRKTSKGIVKYAACKECRYQEKKFRENTPARSPRREDLFEEALLYFMNIKQINPTGKFPKAFRDHIAAETPHETVGVQYSSNMLLRVLESELEAAYDHFECPKQSIELMTNLIYNGGTIRAYELHNVIGHCSMWLATIDDVEEAYEIYKRAKDQGIPMKKQELCYTFMSVASLVESCEVILNSPLSKGPWVYETEQANLVTHERRFEKALLRVNRLVEYVKQQQ